MDNEGVQQVAKPYIFIQRAESDDKEEIYQDVLSSKGQVH